MKVFWCNKIDGLIPYDQKRDAKRVSKFLYWRERQDQEALLVAGDEKYESGSTHSDLFREVEKHISLPNRKPDGAGNVLAGKILDWKSISFEIETPEDLQSIIKNALGILETWW